MGVPKTDYNKILELYDNGLNQAQIARTVGCSEPTVSRVVRKYRAVKADVGLKSVTDHVEKGSRAMQELLTSLEERGERIKWIKDNVAAENSKEFREWLDQENKLYAETRKTIGCMSDIIARFHAPRELELIIGIITEVLSDADPRAVHEIIQKLEATRADRFIN